MSTALSSTLLQHLGSVWIRLMPMVNNMLAAGRSHTKDVREGRTIQHPPATNLAEQTVGRLRIYAEKTVW